MTSEPQRSSVDLAPGQRQLAVTLLSAIIAAAPIVWFATGWFAPVMIGTLAAATVAAGPVALLVGLHLWVRTASQWQRVVRALAYLSASTCLLSAFAALPFWVGGVGTLLLAVVLIELYTERVVPRRITPRGMVRELLAAATILAVVSYCQVLWYLPPGAGWLWFAAAAMLGGQIYDISRRRTRPSAVLMGAAAFMLLPVAFVSAAIVSTLRAGRTIDLDDGPTVAALIVMLGIFAFLGGLQAMLFRGFRLRVHGRPRTTYGRTAKLASGALVRRLNKHAAFHIEWRAPNAKHVELVEDRALAVLIAALGDPESETRYAAAAVLAAMGPRAAPAADDLLRLVGHDTRPGDRAADALAHLGPEGVARLAAALLDASEAVRAAAAAALRLATSDARIAIRPLITALADDSAAVRQRAALTLAEVVTLKDADRAIAALEPLRDDPQTLVRLAAGKALDSLPKHRAPAAP